VINIFCRRLLVAVLLCPLAAANAASTSIDESGSFAVYKADAYSLSIQKQALPINLVGSNTAGIPGGVFALHPNLKSLTAPPSSITVRTLPPIPRPFFMVLTGFICISLVRDRRAWLACLASLMWLGQVGLSSLPQFTDHLRSKKSFQTSFTQNFVDMWRLEKRPIMSRDFIHRKIHISQTAIISEFYHQELSINYLAPGARKYFCLSPELILAQLARGPPNLA